MGYMGIVQFPDGTYVEYARFCGARCEAIGLTTNRATAAKYDARERRLIWELYNRLHSMVTL